MFGSFGDWLYSPSQGHHLLFVLGLTAQMDLFVEDIGMLLDVVLQSSAIRAAVGAHLVAIVVK